MTKKVMYGVFRTPKVGVMQKMESEGLESSQLTKHAIAGMSNCSR